jgi:hypothetical protein
MYEGTEFFNTVFHLFSHPEHFRLLPTGEDAYKLIFNSSFLPNRYECIYHTASQFGLAPPSLEEYITLDESIPEAPESTVLLDTYRFR